MINRCLSLVLVGLWFAVQAAMAAPVLDNDSVPTPCDRVQELLSVTASLRRLPFRQPVRCIELDEPEFRRAQDHQYFALAPAGQLHKEELLFALLRLTPSAYRHEQCYLAESARFISAFYDIVSHRIVIPKDRRTADDTLVHELVHALQDQHFQLRLQTSRAARTSDGSLAFSAVIEGDATAVQQAYLRLFPPPPEEHSGPAPAPEAGDACTQPPSLEALYRFPYGFGPVLIDRALRDSGQKAVDALLRSPPRTTAAVIHSQPIADRSVQLDHAEVRRLLLLTGVNPAAALLLTDTLGQYFIRSLVGVALPVPRAILTGKGWRGDKLLLFEGDGERALIWKSVWERCEDAEEFVAALAALYGIRGFQLPHDHSAGVLFESASVGTVLLKRAVRTVWLVRREEVRP